MTSKAKKNAGDGKLSFTFTVVKAGSDKSHKWMLNRRGNFDEKQDIFMGLP